MQKPFNQLGILHGVFDRHQRNVLPSAGNPDQVKGLKQKTFVLFGTDVAWVANDGMFFGEVQNVLIQANIPAFVNADQFLFKIKNDRIVPAQRIIREKQNADGDATQQNLEDSRHFPPIKRRKYRLSKTEL